MKVLQAIGKSFLWIVYGLLIVVEWIIDTLIKMVVIFHQCLTELMTGIKLTIDAIKTNSP